MVKQLIYHINAINEVELLFAYSNLLRAYKSGKVNKKDFFRLAFCLTRLLSEDACYLSEHINQNEIEENIYCLSLSSSNLMYNKTRGANGGKEIYCFTDMGRMLDKYALSYGNTDKYSYIDKDSELSSQKLSYENAQQIEWEAI